MTGADMVKAAQNGDAGALGLLLREHEAGMRAVALAILGYGPDADDAVQDAMVVALRRIGDLRDPEAAGAWLRTIVRNNCRALLRSRTPMPALDATTVTGPSPSPSPEEALEKTALRDWVWHAIGELSEADRLVMVLRHFSNVTSYEHIAALCGLPVGTVRSRLSHARRKLAEALQATTDAAYADTDSLSETRWREASDLLATAMRGRFDQVVGDFWLPEAQIWYAGRPLGGRDTAIRAMRRDLDYGIRQRLQHVVASEDVLLWETELISPPEDPDHCPPSAVWLHKMRRGRVHTMTLFHPKPAVNGQRMAEAVAMLGARDVAVQRAG
jgi:RNA polymerase sigma-70 factor (ECF subfamily)